MPGANIRATAYSFQFTSLNRGDIDVAGQKTPIPMYQTFPPDRISRGTSAAWFNASAYVHYFYYVRDSRTTSFRNFDAITPGETPGVIWDRAVTADQELYYDGVKPLNSEPLFSSGDKFKFHHVNKKCELSYVIYMMRRRALRHDSFSRDNIEGANAEYRRNFWMLYSIREYEITRGFNLEAQSHNIESNSSQVPALAYRSELGDTDTSV